MGRREQWRPVVGWPEYEISDLGRVRSVERVVMRRNGVPQTVRSKVLSTPPASHGYRNVGLHRPGQRPRVELVHRLVLEAFVGPCPPGLECRHRNSDHHDNRLRNLRWGTRADNNRDIVKHGHHHNANKTECPQGHPYDERNTYRAPGRPNQRRCRTCCGIPVAA